MRAVSLGALLLGLLVACDRKEPVQSDSGAPPVTASAPAPSTTAVGFGHSGSGATHGTISVSPGRGATDEGLRALTVHDKEMIRCSPVARESVPLHVVVNATGTFTVSTGGDASAVAACVIDATKGVELPASSRGTTFDVTITVGP